MAKRSGTETAAILDVAKRLDIIHEDNYQKGRELLIRIIMMLTKLAQKTDWSGSGGLGHAHGLGLVLDRWLSKVQLYDGLTY